MASSPSTSSYSGHGYVSQLNALSAESPAKLEDDKLNRNLFAQAVARSIVACNADQGAFVVGVLGEWGSGKTTIMQWVQRELGGPASSTTNGRSASDGRFATESKRAFVGTWFQPCISRDHMDIGWQLLQSIQTLLTVWQRRTTGPAKAVAKGAGKCMKAALKPLTRSTKSAGEMLVNVGVATGQVHVAAIGASATVFAAGLDSILDEEKVPATASSLHNELRRSFARMQDEDAKTANGRRPLFVLFIDDVDRLDPADARNMFRALKTLCDLPGVVFVVGADPDHVACLIRRDFESQDHSETGSLYLEKFINLPLQLPTIESLSLKKWLEAELLDALGGVNGGTLKDDQLYPREWLEELERVAGEILGDYQVTPLITTPREFTRTLRLFRFRMHVVRHYVHWGDMLLLCAFQAVSQRAYGALMKAAFNRNPRETREWFQSGAWDIEYIAKHQASSSNEGEQSQSEKLLDGYAKTILSGVPGWKVVPLERVLRSLVSVQGSSSVKTWINDYQHTGLQRRFSNDLSRNAYFAIDCGLGLADTARIRRFVYEVLVADHVKAVSALSSFATSENLWHVVIKLEDHIREFGSQKLSVFTEAQWASMSRNLTQCMAHIAGLSVQNGAHVGMDDILRLPTRVALSLQRFVSTSKAESFLKECVNVLSQSGFATHSYGLFQMVRELDLSSGEPSPYFEFVQQLTGDGRAQWRLGTAALLTHVVSEVGDDKLIDVQRTDSTLPVEAYFVLASQAHALTLDANPALDAIVRSTTNSKWIREFLRQVVYYGLDDETDETWKQSATLRPDPSPGHSAFGRKWLDMYDSIGLLPDFIRALEQVSGVAQSNVISRVTAEKAAEAHWPERVLKPLKDQCVEKGDMLAWLAVYQQFLAV